MTVGLFLALLTISLACCLPAYRTTALERGWPIGSIYATEKPIFIALCCIVGAVVRILYGAMHDHYGWWTLLLILPAWFVGGPIILNSLKGSCGPIAIFGAPITLAVAFLFK